jgi:glutamine amidotransferase/cyclase
MTSDLGRPPRIAVIDYGAGNLVSIEQGLRAAGAVVTLAGSPDDLRDAEAVVVPGVGAAAPAMRRLERRGFVTALRAWIQAGRPYLGICLGLQLLFESSEEDGATMLGVIPGVVRRLDDAPTLPHIGWNQVHPVRPHGLFAGLEPGSDLYFVHSYAGVPGPDVAEATVLATTDHGAPFVSAVAVGPLLGVQFHPERSGDDGLRVLANFSAITARATNRLAAGATPAGLV